MKHLSHFPRHLVMQLHGLISRTLGRKWVREFDDSESFAKGMRKLGFRERSHFGASYACTQWVHRKLRLIFKCSFVCNRRIPKAAIPTLVIRKARGHLALLQPLADTSRCHEAQQELQDLPIAVRGIDVHGSNVGHYKGKPVVFDW